MKRPRRIIVAAVFVALTGLIAQPAHAATTKSITLSPSSTSLTLEPAVAATRAITLINDGDTPYDVSLSAEPYRVQDENYDPIFTRLPGTTDASAWVKLSQKSITLAAHQTATVTYAVTAPQATAPGGYYAVIFAQTNSTSDGGVSASNRVGDILYMTVDGKVTQSGSVSGESIPHFVFGSAVNVGVKVTNSGGVHFQSDTKFNVSGLGGSSVFSNESTHYVLPQTTRLIEATWNPTSIAGIYKVSRSATVAGHDQTLPDAWIVVATPKVIPLVIFIVLALVGFFILLSRTRKHRH